MSLLSDVWCREISVAAGGIGVGDTCLEGLMVTQQLLPELAQEESAMSVLPGKVAALPVWMWDGRHRLRGEIRLQGILGVWSSDR